MEFDFTVVKIHQKEKINNNKQKRKLFLLPFRQALMKLFNELSKDDW
jgi:hypothetical protein